MCVCMCGGQACEMGKITVLKVTIGLGENADRQQYLRDSPNIYVELK